MYRLREQILVGLASILLLTGLINCKLKPTHTSYWLVFNDTVKNQYGYKDEYGNIMIPPGKYSFCFTDTFRNYAIVAINTGFGAIDRKENILYRVFSFDNGTDYISEGFFRIIKDNKIGYAEARTGKIAIEPKFSCAYPFENGVAKVSTNCRTQLENEHNIWLSEDYFFIDHKGQKVNTP